MNIRHRSHEAATGPAVGGLTYCGYDSQPCPTPDLCGDSRCARSVACRHCGEPSGIYLGTLRANRATGVVCAACACEMTVDP